MATHILTVTETTFKIHLKYMFIGTGRNGYSHQNGALADILSIRENDNIIFYVMNVGFFGIFKAVGSVFYDYNSYQNHHPQYLNDYLDNKTLTYRMKIEALEVYQDPISEWDMMENPNNIQNQSIYNMQWSWIFKKLNAARGCLSLDNHEFTLFKNILIANNQRLNNGLNYNYTNRLISLLNDGTVYDTSCTTCSPRTDDVINKIDKEEDLRILFTAQSGNHNTLNQVLQPNNNGNINLISNEILCSFSERKMDLLFGTDQNKCLLIELKNEFIFNTGIYNQIKEYSRWISAYKINYINIIPILIIKEARILPKRRGSKYFKYLSRTNRNNNVVSYWYQSILNEISQAKINLQNENIDRVDDLQVYIFNTDENNTLVSFESI